MFLIYFFLVGSSRYREFGNGKFLYETYRLFHFFLIETFSNVSLTIFVGSLGYRLDALDFGKW